MLLKIVQESRNAQDENDGMAGGIVVSATTEFVRNLEDQNEPLERKESEQSRGGLFLSFFILV